MRRIIIAMLLCVGIVSAQQSGSLVWNPNGSNATVNAPTNAGALTYTLPGKSGTLALTSDVPPAPGVANGSISLTSGTGTALIPSASTRCIVSDPSGNSVRYVRAGTSLTVWSGGLMVDWICV